MNYPLNPVKTLIFVVFVIAGTIVAGSGYYKDRPHATPPPAETVWIVTHPGPMGPEVLGVYGSAKKARSELKYLKSQGVYPEDGDYSTWAWAVSR